MDPTPSYWENARMTVRSLMGACLILSLGGGLGSLAYGQLWFDGGRPDTTIVHAANDSTCFESFPPFCMGPLPPRSFVWEKIELVGCRSLRWADQVCWNGSFVRGARIEFNDGGCGCGGYVEIPTTLRLSYDRAVAAAAGIAESSLRLIYNDAESRSWREVPQFEIDAAAGCLTTPVTGKILGIREYAIVGPSFTPVRETTWGSVKRLYGAE